MKKIFLGQIKDGKIQLHEAKEFNLLKISLEGKKIEMTLKKHINRRSTGKLTDTGNQNGYFWGIFLPIVSEASGHMPDELYTALEVKFCRIGGTDDFPIVKKLKEHNTKEWEEKIEVMRIWANDFYNINIPTVDDYYSGRVKVN